MGWFWGGGGAAEWGIVGQYGAQLMEHMQMHVYVCACECAWRCVSVKSVHEG